MYKSYTVISLKMQQYFKKIFSLKFCRWCELTMHNIKKIQNVLTQQTLYRTDYSTALQEQPCLHFPSDSTECPHCETKAGHLDQDPSGVSKSSYLHLQITFGHNSWLEREQTRYRYYGIILFIYIYIYIWRNESLRLQKQIDRFEISNVT